jgi:DNA-binding CsgD family transcriptional regulator
MQYKSFSQYALTRFNSVMLTQREYSVLSLIAEGYSSTQIARRLFLGYETIKTHRKNIMRKLNATNTASLITKSFQTGLLKAYN